MDLGGSARISKKQPCGHVRRPEGRQAKRSISAKEAKIPKSVKSASSIEKKNLEILPNPKRDYPKVIKSHEDRQSSKSKLSSKAAIWGSPQHIIRN
jgi:hypothetical protein